MIELEIGALQATTEILKGSKGGAA